MTHLDTLVNCCVDCTLAREAIQGTRAAEQARQMTEVLHPCIVLGSVEHTFNRINVEGKF